MIIRPLAPEDETQWREQWAGYLAFYKTALPPAQTALTWARLLDPLEPMSGLGAFEGDELLGFTVTLLHRSTWARVGYLYLEDLFTTEAARGRGVARALIDAVYRHADELGAERVYWVTAADNVTARALYDKVAKEAGFVQYRRG
jgi:GNAT superfamily N-acetyltransferase